MATTERATGTMGEAPAVPSRAEGGSGRAFPLRSFANWSVRTKLIAILVLPVAAACAVGVVRVDDLLDTASDLGTDVAVSEAQRATAELVRQIGVEQVVAVADVTEAVFDAGALPTLDAQQTATDTAANRAATLVAGLDEPSVELRRSTTGLENALDALVDVRANSSAASGTAGLTPAQVVRAYDEVSGSALRLGDSLAGAIEDDRIQSLAISSQSLVATNRQVAKEDSFVLATAEADPDVVVINPAELRTVVTDRAAAFTDFQAAGSAQQQADYAREFASDSGAQRTGLLTDVLRSLTAGGTPSLTAANWIGAAVPSATNLGGVQQRISDEQVSTAESLRDDTRNRALREAILLVVLLLLGFGITFLAVRSVLRPLRVLQADAMEIAQRTLPEEIQRIRDGRAEPDQAVQPVGVGTVEEIGQVARAFDAVHQEALRLAGDQEQLRRNVNEIFVNLSRRSQGLVERQLALIDRLENEEQDPDQLSQLFRLDHLAARMRRNNDNLMVLAGSEGSRGVSRPMAVVDVVRAAVSETDQYERVTINPTPLVTVSAGAAKDLVHLLAELLDNATVFSSPSSTVTVAVSGTYQEGLVIEVYDRGLGIPAAELDGLNRKLAEAPVIDAQVPRQMGLFVVARLAGRHEMQVELRASAAGAGTVAAVWIPPAALVSEDQLDPDRAAPATVDTRTPQVLRPPVRQPVARQTVAAPVMAQQVIAPLVPAPQVSARPAPAVATAGPPAAALATPPAVRPTADLPPDGEATDLPSGGEATDAPFGAQPSSLPALPGTEQPSTTPVPLGLTPNQPVAVSSGSYETSNGAVDTMAPVSGSFGDGQGYPPAEDNDDVTPIFAAVSAWFQQDTVRPAQAPAAASPAAASPGATRRAPGGVATGATVHEFPRPGQAVRPPAAGGPGVAPAATAPAAAVPPAAMPPAAMAPAAAAPPAAVSPSVLAPSGRRSFDSPADAGWRAVQAAAAVDTGSETTSAGLPKRRPKANLVPGSAAPEGAAEATARARNADAVRGRLSSYQRGLQSGRLKTTGNGDPDSEESLVPARVDVTEPDRGHATDPDVTAPGEQDGAERHAHVRDDERRYAR